MSKVYGKYVIIDGRDVGKSTEDLLRDLLFESTGARIPEDKIQYGKPEELDQRPHDIYDPNTFIPVIVDIVYDTRYRTVGDGFMYRRRSIAEHTKNVDFTMIRPEFFPFRVSDIIDQVNAQLEYPIAMTELVEYEYSSTEQWMNGVLLQAKPDSYLWTGYETVQIDTSDINHTNLLEKHELDGFNIYQPPDGVRVVPGFDEYRGGCLDPLCPVCKENGRVHEGTPAHVRAIVDMNNRPVNESFRDTPHPDVLPVPFDKTIDLVIKTIAPGTSELDLVIDPPEDPVPTPLMDGVSNPYSQTIETDCDGLEVDMSVHAVPSQNVDSERVDKDDPIDWESFNADINTINSGAGGSTASGSGGCGCG